MNYDARVWVPPRTNTRVDCYTVTPDQTKKHSAAPPSRIRKTLGSIPDGAALCFFCIFVEAERERIWKLFLFSPGIEPGTLHNKLDRLSQTKGQDSVDSSK